MKTQAKCERNREADGNAKARGSAARCGRAARVPDRAKRTIALSRGRAEPGPRKLGTKKKAAPAKRSTHGEEGGQASGKGRRGEREDGGEAHG
jgi:predicted NodU family carbamoyl transferase